VFRLQQGHRKNPLKQAVLLPLPVLPQFPSCPDIDPFLRFAAPHTAKSLSPAEKLKVVQGLMKEGHEGAAAIYDTIGAYFGYAIAFYSEFYDIKHVLIMGRVTSGDGGVILLERAQEVLDKEFPELAAKVELHIPDENS
jgi:hypothetical protein